jgi:hypothetical protein
VLNRTTRFLKNIISASWNCVSEELSVLPIAILITICVGPLWLACDVISEGENADVPSLVSALSINPDNWN